MLKYNIAVVTPVFNGEKTIEKSIFSLLRQTYKNWIQIIINDGSTDRTREIIQKYNDDPRFIIVHLSKNMGRPHARNVALEIVLQLNIKYMCMLDSDDLYYPDKLEWQFNFMERNETVSLLSSSMGYINHEGQMIGVLESYKRETNFYFSNWNRYKEVPHASSIIRTSDIGDIDFDEKMILGQDHDFLKRLLLNKKYVFIPRISYLYSRTESFSFSKYKQALDLRIYSIKKYQPSFWLILKIQIVNLLKRLYLRILFILKREDIYFNKIIRSATPEEKVRHNHFIEKSKMFDVGFFNFIS